MKKLVTLLLALVLLLTMAAPALAEDTGSITIDNAVVDKTYTIYRIFDLNGHNADYSAINYTVNDKWTAFFAEGAAGLDYVAIDELGYVTWKDGASAANFAAAAIAFAKADNIANDGSQKATGNEVKFTDLPLGYYLVQSDLGALCSLDTTMPDVVIEEKNSAPTVEKEVKENSTDIYGKKNDASIGDTVEFKTTIRVIDGAPMNYVLHDKMSEGLTFDANSVVVNVGEKTLAAGSDYTLTSTGLADGCTFEIAFTEGTLKPNDVVTVEYKATLNDKAVVAGAGNPNETWLKYGENNTTTHDVTKTYTWEVKVLKYTNKADVETPLAGAEFVLYREVDGEKQYVITDANHKVTGWVTDKTQATTFITPADGKFSITGLDTGVYYLEETKEPDGYNKLANPIKVVISATYDDAAGTGTATVTYNEDDVANPDIKVLNQTGTELPSTGGMGTTLFYVVGGLLVAVAVVLLVTKKKMSADK